MPATEWLGRSISDEFEGSQLGDKRRSDRLGWLAEKLMAAPGVGFPQAVDTPSELEGVYRFLRNEQFDAEQILDPHLSATVERVSSAGLCIVAHDTTEVSLGGASRRAGLGVTSGGSQGFLAHVALAVLPGGSECHSEFWVYSDTSASYTRVDAGAAGLSVGETPSANHCAGRPCSRPSMHAAPAARSFT